MPRKGEMSDMDAFEERIRAGAVNYNVVQFIPGQSSRLRETIEDLDDAIQYGTEIFDENPEVRASMVYAINADGRHALMGTINRDRVWKPVKVKRY